MYIYLNYFNLYIIEGNNKISLKKHIEIIC